MATASPPRPSFNRWRLGRLVDVEAERVLFDWAHSNADAEEAAFQLEDRQAPPQEDDGLDLRDPADVFCLALVSPTPGRRGFE